MNTRGYFDYNATTPVCPEAIRTFHAVIEDFGNPSSKYGLSKPSKALLQTARSQVARLMGAPSDGIYFTSGGTEANNWAIKGALTTRGAIGRSAAPAHLIVSQVEHSSILEVAAYLERVFGFEVTRLAPDRAGRITAASVEASLKPHTQLVSLMLVNNEVGTVQPVADVARLLRHRDIHFHVDGVQAVGKIDVDVAALGVDTLGFAAHKFYGPKGVGGLYVRPGVQIEPMIHGGGQERGMRGGTEGVAAIAAMGAAAEATLQDLPAFLTRMSTYRDALRSKLLQRVAGVAFNGSSAGHEQAPNTLSLRVDGVRAEAVAALLDSVHGIQVSLGSACSNNKSVSLSHVLLAMGLSEAEIQATLRVSIGRYTEEGDLDAFAGALSDATRLLRRVARTGEESHAVAA